MLDKYDIVVALNQQSLDKFAPQGEKRGGVLIYEHQRASTTVPPATTSASIPS